MSTQALGGKNLLAYMLTCPRNCIATQAVGNALTIAGHLCGGGQGGGVEACWGGSLCSADGALMER